ncbi:MAG: flagellar motor protein MotB [Gammaproteobacteria bacterium]|nr:flagellar motor protein MotB [Gammaproteobacteria bacterium]NND39668.1 flagellar motor protein MotB [Pseudomonadales bacterium]NNM12630.1 flagellar motor protein MotB [Pseudomonadales bacterium]
MLDDDEHECDCPPEGLPAYMGTFADLMALLMCFFVLLLSFAEMDVLKFKRLAGSMKTAFGVQREVKANEIPMGTSIIAQEFSPGRPEPTPINNVMQRTSDDPQRNLQVQCTPDQMTELESINEQANSGQSEFVEQLAELIEETRADAVSLANALAKQIRDGEVEIETQGRKITVRIKEKGSFNSGSDRLTKGFDMVLHDVRDLLATMKGQVLVQGHTDNIAISTSRFRSNWELSAARAVSVAEELLSEAVLDPRRLQVSGFSYTRPLVDNNTPENRALNRRVEIVINQDVDAALADGLEDLREQNPQRAREIDVTLTPRFNIQPDEIF